jgi:hypothetical protein
MHYHPAPSSDGKWLAYGSKRDGVRQLYVMRLSDKKERRITDFAKGHSAMWPHWQPRVALVAREAAAQLPKSKRRYVATATLASAHATQAAAADEKVVYAIANSFVIKYDRASGRELAKSTGEAKHLNSGFLWEGKLYCAHSNYPRKPHESDIRVLDPATMELRVFHEFEKPPGSLTWAVRQGEQWWCHFAHYGKDNAQSVLVQFGKDWRETRRWMYPETLIADWGTYSLSGGVWDGDDLLATGHDKRVIYRLRVSASEKYVQVIDVISSPFPGQAIATVDGGLVGIDRGKRQVVFAKLK